MDPITIASLVAMVAGSYMKHQAQQDANARQQQVIQRSLAQQRELQVNAEKTAMEAAQTFAPEKREAEQAQVTQQIEQNLLSPVSESQHIRDQQQATQGDTSDAYKTAKAKSELQSLQSAQMLAKMLGKASSAGRLRADEAVRLMNTGQKIDQYRNFASGNDGVTQIQLNAAGQVDPNAQLFGSILQSGGMAGAMGAYGGSADLSSGGAALQYGTNAGSPQSALLASQEAGMGTAGLWNTGGSLASGFKNLKSIFQ